MVGKVPMEREDGVPSRKEYEYGSWYLHCLEVVEEGLPKDHIPMHTHTHPLTQED